MIKFILGMIIGIPLGIFIAWLCDFWDKLKDYRTVA